MKKAERALLEKPFLLCKWCGGKATQDRRNRVRNFCSKACASRWTAKNRSTSKGWTLTSRGYRAIHMPDHPNAASYGYVLEHRLVVEKNIGRLLLPNEVVHHLDGNKLNNAPENLEVLTKTAHDKLPKKRTGTIQCPHCAEKIILSRFARVVARHSTK